MLLLRFLVAYSLLFSSVKAMVLRTRLLMFTKTIKTFAFIEIK